MGFFTTGESSTASDNSSSKPAGSRKDFFSRYGYSGRITPRRFGLKMRSIPMRPAEKEYVKSVMRKFDAPYSRGITREEFLKGLDEMKKNKRDNITDRQVEKIKKYFE